MDDLATVLLGELVIPGQKPYVDEFGVAWGFQQIEGWWDDTESVGDSFKKEYSDGRWIGPSTEDGRPILLKASAHGDPSLMSAAIDRINSAIPRTLKRFSVIEGGRARYVMVRKEGKPGIIWDGGRNVQFSVQLFAPEPRKFAGDGSARYSLSQAVGLPFTSGGLQLPGARVLRRNGVTNPAFESNLAGWAVNRVNATQDSSSTINPAAFGPGRGVVSVAQVGYWPRMQATLDPSSWAVGQPITVSAYVAANTLPLYSHRIGVQCAGPGGTQLALVNGVTSAVRGARISATVPVVPEGTEAITVWLGHPDSTAVGIVAAFDGVQSDMALEPSEFFMGDTANTQSRSFAWAGTPHASASVETAAAGFQFATRVLRSNFLLTPKPTSVSSWATGGYGSGGSAVESIVAGASPAGNNVHRTTWNTAATGGGHERNADGGSMPAGTYTMSAYMRVNQALGSGLIRSYVGGTIISDGAGTALPANTWVRVRQTVTTTTAGVLRIGARVGSLAGTSAGFILDVADMMIEEGSVATPFLEGDQPSADGKFYSWTGPFNNSASTESTGGLQIVATVVSGSVTLTNAGNARPPVLVTFTGPVTNPVLRSSDGGVMRFNIVLSAGQQLAVDLDAKTVKLNGVNRRNALVGSWIVPAAGMELRFDADSYNPDALMTVQWSDAWR